MGKLILIVEDESGIKDTVTYALTREGFTCLWAPTGEDALRSVQARLPDLIVLDVGLPDTDGFTLFRALRQFAAETPVIFLTARSEEVDRVVGLELGADDYVAKPFSPRELVARVRAVLRRAESSPPVPQHQGSLPWEVNDQKKEFRIHGRPLELSAQEFKIIAFLSKAPGRVYSREQIMNAVWEDPLMSLERTVDAHIKTIRGKIREADASLDLIATHRGFGYSFREPSSGE